MRNPWPDLPVQAPYVFSADAPHLDAFNEHASSDTSLLLGLLPEPFMGDPRSASVLLLQRNPGFAATEARWHRRSEYGRAVRDNLAHERTNYLDLFLRGPFKESPGGKWLRSRLRVLAEAVGDHDRLVERLAIVEFHGYHSRRYTPIPMTLPSQRYGFDLVRRAVAREAMVVVVRGRRDWAIAVPELRSYGHLITLSNPQSAYLTPRACSPAGFRKLVAAFR